jgi:hypothetical protein
MLVGPASGGTLHVSKLRLRQKAACILSATVKPADAGMFVTNRALERPVSVKETSHGGMSAGIPPLWTDGGPSNERHCGIREHEL